MLELPHKTPTLPTLPQPLVKEQTQHPNLVATVLSMLALIPKKDTASLKPRSQPFSTRQCP